MTNRLDSPDRIDHLLRRHNPTAALEEWDPAQRQDLLHAAFADGHRTAVGPRSVGSRTRRWLVAGGVTAAAAATVLSFVLPAGAPGGPDPAAAALRHLAVQAGTRDLRIEPNQYGFTSAREEQPPGSTHDFKAWITRSGDTWFSPGPDGSGCLNAVAAARGGPEAGDYALLGTDALSRLPKDVAGLARFLDSHPSGDNRGPRNRFIAIGDLLRLNPLASGRLRATAITVLADTPGLSVDTSARDALDRPAIMISQTTGEWTDSLYFDPDTSQILQEQTDQDTTVVARSIVLQTAAADTLPDLPPCPTGTTATVTVIP